MMAGNCAFANQAATNAEQAACMVTSLNNLANTAIQKNDMVEKLVAANKRLAKALVNANAVGRDRVSSNKLRLDRQLRRTRHPCGNISNKRNKLGVARLGMTMWEMREAGAEVSKQ
jgi:hypothetical protein